MAGKKKKSPPAEAGAGAPDVAAPRTSLWARLAAPAPAARAVLTPERIAEVAVGIADAEGIEAVTMRRLATELGVAPMAAYRYVSGKDDLLELMVDRAYGELVAPQPGAGWRAALRDPAVNTRELVLRHPWLVRLPSARAAVAPTPNRMAVAEWGLRELAEAGLSADEAMAAVEAVGSYVHGRTAAEIATRHLMAAQGAPDDANALRTSLAPEMTWLIGTGHYPAFRNYLASAQRKDDHQWRFETGLDALLDGLAARLRI
ncbi:TetR family transcriptional regulator [Embleya scabrispora]|uniref:TetR family transcriptional regulator n=1 Tax=Embleya scabrispora TaxID=159449 RepID=A0A1T3NW05_9ACTN|nr:TetR/AcrR family transcriptional regulator [Embleya scabrispora]OPC81016.1 TetR family transcriptional regulator [Embleya scabrispora]